MRGVRDMIEIPLGHGLVTIVDDDTDQSILGMRWCPHTVRSQGSGEVAGYYAIGRLKSSKVYLHRLITGAVAGILVDHIDRNRLNNRRMNLRLCTPSENSCNRQRRKTKSGYPGVFAEAYEGRSLRFRGFVEIGGKRYRTKKFRRPEDAAQARSDLARTLHGEFFFGSKP